MDNYDLSIEDLDSLERITRVTYHIDNIYNRLYQLEIEGKKNTDEYKKMLNYLNMFLDMEKEEYDKANLNNNKCIAYIGILIMSNPDNELEQNSLDYLANGDYTERIKARIVYRAFSFISNNAEILLGQVEEARIDVVNEAMLIGEAIKEDMFNLCMNMVQSFIDNKNFNKSKFDLILLKYNLAFVECSVEETMIESSFTPSDKTTFKSESVADLFDINSFDLGLIRNTQILQILKNHITGLLDIDDEDYGNKSKITESILRQCIIKASLQLVADDTFNEMFSKTGDIFVGEIDLNKISVSIVLQAIKDREKDKEKYIVSSNKKKIKNI